MNISIQSNLPAIVLLLSVALLIPATASAQQNSQPIQRTYTAKPQVDLAAIGTDKGANSAIENSMDYLAKQIKPPSQESSSGGIALFKDPKTKHSAIQTGATLTLVLSVFLIIVFLLRLRPNGKGMGRGRRTRNGQIPSDVLSVLGQIPFGQNQQLQLIRLGTRMLLVSTTATGSQTLGEISDPEEVWQIETACRDGKFEGLTEVLQQRAQASHQQRTQNRRSGISLGSHQSTGGGRTLLEA